jgi:hypothetical protein
VRAVGTSVDSTMLQAAILRRSVERSSLLQSSAIAQRWTRVRSLQATSATKSMKAHDQGVSAHEGSLEGDYEVLPYPSMPFAYTQPAHLAALATLFGVSTAAATQARVLELGCASGGNLIPLAARFPHARFFGVDLSRRPHRPIGRRQRTLWPASAQRSQAYRRPARILYPRGVSRAKQRALLFPRVCGSGRTMGTELFVRGRLRRFHLGDTIPSDGKPAQSRRRHELARTRVMQGFLHGPSVPPLHPDQDETRTERGD